MAEIFLPVISDSYYIKSTWFEDIISGIEMGTKSLRKEYPVKNNY